uniref:Uncharacterized protein n=1 Tax=Chromera velia CCMP2878 TaxID=1169474 RepID=A0A0G4HVM6_9ALVE|eukprot:Cvel_1423.t1-p1 / transcript=Cvel_1423.t1 / gene=Cvel_1423 / organism=Chromera_velia_CCMP2878 / gene_product=hypothetical protein / transcript_product=hypothetical protein / location=Cvel_scaffold49:146438-153425(+) / protein_length=221 / sequence_SO=supercontig / SO=protein_coding / is_pseudo=false
MQWLNSRQRESGLPYDIVVSKLYKNAVEFLVESLRPEEIRFIDPPHAAVMGPRGTLYKDGVFFFFFDIILLTEDPKVPPKISKVKYRVKSKDQEGECERPVLRYWPAVELCPHAEISMDWLHSAEVSNVVKAELERHTVMPKPPPPFSVAPGQPIPASRPLILVSKKASPANIQTEVPYVLGSMSPFELAMSVPGSNTDELGRAADWLASLMAYQLQETNM